MIFSVGGLVLAGMKLLGKWNWWFTRFLERLPRIDLGEDKKP
jgi:uncharacterized membrane protein YdfJ with MMPL/SSD domain